MKGMVSMGEGRHTGKAVLCSLVRIELWPALRSGTSLEFASLSSDRSNRTDWSPCRCYRLQYPAQSPAPPASSALPPCMMHDGEDGRRGGGGSVRRGGGGTWRRAGSFQAPGRAYSCRRAFLLAQIDSAPKHLQPPGTDCVRDEEARTRVSNSSRSRRSRRSRRRSSSRRRRRRRQRQRRARRAPIRPVACDPPRVPEPVALWCIPCVPTAQAEVDRPACGRR